MSPSGRLLSKWREEELKKQAQREKEQVGLLPEDLAEQIIAAGDHELKLITKRERVLSKSLEKLTKMRSEARKNKRVALEAAGGIRDEAVIEVGDVLLRIQRNIDQHKAELRDLHRQRNEVLKVQKQARLGVVNALLTIVSGWKNQVVGIGVLAPAARCGRSYCDAVGNPLPQAALGPDGKPVSTPSARRAYGNADKPLIVPEDV